MEKAPRRRGRPRTNLQPQSWVSTKLAESDHDRLIRLAIARRVSVAAVIRAVIRAALEHHPA